MPARLPFAGGKEENRSLPSLQPPFLRWGFACLLVPSRAGGSHVPKMSSCLQHGEAGQTLGRFVGGGFEGGKSGDHGFLPAAWAALLGLELPLPFLLLFYITVCRERDEGVRRWRGEAVGHARAVWSRRGDPVPHTPPPTPPPQRAWWAVAWSLCKHGAQARPKQSAASSQ